MHAWPFPLHAVQSADGSELVVEGVAAGLEGVHVAAEERDVGVDAPVPVAGRHEDEEALHRQVAGHEEARPAAAEVEVVVDVKSRQHTRMC